MAERDVLSEMRSQANLSETNRRLNRWEQSCAHSLEYIRLSRLLADKSEECRALQSLGDVYLARGKREVISSKDTEPGCYPPEVTDPLKESLVPFEESIALARQLSANQLLGRGLGNLGYVCYLLGLFGDALVYQQERLGVAVQEGDKVAQNVSHTNLANSSIYTGDTKRALQHYTRSVALSADLGDVTHQANCCYSVGNCYYVLRQFQLSADSLLKYLQLSAQLHNKAGSLRACWALSQSYLSLDRHRDAMRYAKLHLSLARELNRATQVEVAEHNVSVLQRHNLRHRETDPEKEVMLSAEELISPVSHGDTSEIVVALEGDELSMEDSPHQLDHFLIDRLFSSQGRRLEDQRCPVLPSRTHGSNIHTSKSVDELILLIADKQINRMDDQRAPLSNQKTIQRASLDDGITHFLDRCQHHSLEDQRSSVPLRGRRYQRAEETEDFYNLIMQAQSHQLEDQRTSAHVPLL